MSYENSTLEEGIDKLFRIWISHPRGSSIVGFKPSRKEAQAFYAGLSAGLVLADFEMPEIEKALEVSIKKMKQEFKI